MSPSKAKSPGVSPLPAPIKLAKAATRRPIAITLNFGLSITVFLALIRVFDPSLDEHITTIQNKKEKNQQNFSVHLPLPKKRDRTENNTNMLKESLQNKEGDSDVENMPPRDRVLDLLEEAGLRNFTTDELRSLPKWSDVSCISLRSTYHLRNR